MQTWQTQLVKEMKSLSSDHPINSIMLTGGRSASSLYSHWSKTRSFKGLNNVNFYITDERIVPISNKDSNRRSIELLISRKSDKKKIWFLKTENIDIKKEIFRYSEVLPSKLDLILLSVGEDGHIASIFPYSAAFLSGSKIAYVPDAPKFPSKRFTVTPKVLLDAKNIIVMAMGAQKGVILAKSLENPSNTRELPVRLTIGRTWIFDKQAYEAFMKNLNSSIFDTKVIHE